jgi:hypothetical protein
MQDKCRPARPRQNARRIVEDALVLSENKNWKCLKEWLTWAGRFYQAAFVITTVCFPLAECFFVNLLTGAEPGKAWPFAVAVGLLGVSHLTLVILMVFWGKGAEIVCAANAIEVEQKLLESEKNAKECEDAMRRELDRRADCQRMIRAAIEDLNLQTCQIDPTGPNAFCRGFAPIIQRVVGNIRTTLGVTANQFSIELYIESGTVMNGNPCGPADGPDQQLFYSPNGLDPCGPVRKLGQRAPHRWGWSRGLPGYCRVENDKGLFYESDKPAADLYFRTFATVPVTQSCSSDQVGLLVLTSMQTEPFAPDALDTLQFLASLVSQYQAAHNRCVEEWYQRNRYQQ